MDTQMQAAWALPSCAGELLRIQHVWLVPGCNWTQYLTSVTEGNGCAYLTL